MDPPVPLAVAREWHARLAGNALSRRYMAVRTRPPKQVPEPSMYRLLWGSKRFSTTHKRALCAPAGGRTGRLAKHPLNSGNYAQKRRCGHAGASRHAYGIGGALEPKTATVPFLGSSPSPDCSRPSQHYSGFDALQRPVFLGLVARAVLLVVGSDRPSLCDLPSGASFHDHNVGASIEVHRDNRVRAKACRVVGVPMLR
jgi:hypothetical protein